MSGQKKIGNAEEAARQAVALYYDLSGSSKWDALGDIFEKDATVKYVLDYSGVQPNDEYDFSPLSDPSAYLSPFSENQTDIDSVDVADDKVTVSVTTAGTYEWEGATGTTTGRDTFDVVISPDSARIKRYELVRTFQS